MRYRDARRGREWREALFERYGWNRWYLNVRFRRVPDLRGLREPAARSSSAGAGEPRGKAPRSPMLDMYPIGPLGLPRSTAMMAACVGNRRSFRRLRIRDQLYEAGDQHHGRPAGSANSPICSNSSNILSSSGTGNASLGVSIHQPLPCEREFHAVAGVLLHFKFFSTTRKRSNRQSPTGSISMLRPSTARCLKIFRRPVSSTFPMRCSTRVSSSRQLLELGFIGPVR